MILSGELILGVAFSYAAKLRCFGAGNANVRSRDRQAQNLLPFPQAFSGNEKIRIERLIMPYVWRGDIESWSYAMGPCRELLSVRGPRDDILFIAKEAFSGKGFKPSYLMNFETGAEKPELAEEFSTVLAAIESHLQGRFDPTQKVNKIAPELSVPQ